MSETRRRFYPSLPLINWVNREEDQVKWTSAGVASSDFKSVLEMKTKSFSLHSSINSTLRKLRKSRENHLMVSPISIQTNRTRCKPNKNRAGWVGSWKCQQADIFILIFYKKRSAVVAEAKAMDQIVCFDGPADFLWLAKDYRKGLKQFTVDHKIE